MKVTWHFGQKVKAQRQEKASYSEEPANTSVMMQIEGPDRRMLLGRKAFAFGVVIWQSPSGKFRV